MTKIVGIDFGTTNVRIAQRDNGGDTASCAIGMGRSETGDEWVPTGDEWMPAVIAFTKQPNGDVETVIGEAANALPTDDPNTIVVPNIKRLATASDQNVREVIEWYFERRGTDWPKRLDAQNRSIRAWDKDVSSEEAVKLILKEAIARAGLAGEVAEWRAGCPVSSGLPYRKALIDALDELGCKGRVEWVVEEPLLLLALGMGIGTLVSGELCMVYDLGGGSFDCAVARIEDGGGLTVYANEGLPRGGSDIDRLLEQAGIDWNDGRVSEILENDGLVNETLMAMLNAYHKAGAMLKLPDEEGEYSHNLNWSGGIESMIADIDKFLITGGPTESPHFLAKLEEALGESGAKKMMTADELVEEAGIDYMANAKLTALSHGACYMVGNQHFPVSVDRVPATITLTVSDGHHTDEDAYEAFSRMPYRNPKESHEGRWVTLQSDGAKTYRVVIKNADGEVIHDSEEHPMRMPRDGYIGPIADRAMLVVNRFGSVWVRLAAGSSNVPQPLEDDIVILRSPIWQTGLQKDVMEKLEEIERRREEERKARMLHNLYPKPLIRPASVPPKP